MGLFASMKSEQNDYVVAGFHFARRPCRIVPTLGEGERSCLRLASMPTKRASTGPAN